MRFETRPFNPLVEALKANTEVINGNHNRIKVVAGPDARGRYLLEYEDGERYWRSASDIKFVILGDDELAAIHQEKLSLYNQCGDRLKWLGDELARVNGLYAEARNVLYGENSLVSVEVMNMSLDNLKDRLAAINKICDKVGNA